LWSRLDSGIQMEIYDTMEQKKIPAKLEKEVKIYICGLTPYSSFHMGHARTYCAFDSIIRYLEYKKHKVIYVQNITDVDDKLINKSLELKESVLSISERIMKEALSQMDELNIRRADFYPKVSTHIPEIISTIEKIMENGFAYEVEGNVYFEVGKFGGYGKLSNKNVEELIAGARVEKDPLKRNPEDFALWKRKKENEPVSFESPWGEGRPGWHIECSAMSMKYLGETFDIHGGARDLIFPHHENEIAQSEAANRKEFVRHWMHTGFLTVNGEKMSKSLGNFVTVGEVLAKYNPEVLRLFFAQTHYRSPVDFSWEELEKSKKALEKIYITIAKIDLGLKLAEENKEELDLKKYRKEFEKFMEDDFSAPRAIAVLFELISHINENYSRISKKSLSEAGDLLYELWGLFGILIKEKDARKRRGNEIEKLLEKRTEARKDKNFPESDRIRKELNERGIVIIDEKNGSAWYSELKPVKSN